MREGNVEKHENIIVYLVHRIRAEAINLIEINVIEQCFSNFKPSTPL